MKLNEAAQYVGKTTTFCVVIQQITKGKRAVIDQNRIVPFNMILLADTTSSFFKLICWRNVPTLSLEEHAPTDVALCVGDIALFSKCVIKSYRGNYESHFTQESTVRLLYRKDRYFSTEGVSVADLLSMIEWYKQYKKELCIQPIVAYPMICTRVKDLRENMIVNIKGRIILAPTTIYPKYNKNILKEMDMPINKLVHVNQNAEIGGSIVTTVSLQDKFGDTISINLWDQHTEKPFVAALLTHFPGEVEVKGLVISYNSHQLSTYVSTQLVANTTPFTEFCLITQKKANTIYDNCENNRSFDKNLTVAKQHLAGLQGENIKNKIILEKGLSLSSSFHPAARSHARKCREAFHLLSNIKIEQIIFPCFLGAHGKILPEYTPLLVEKYCNNCKLRLPEQTNMTNPPLPPVYGPCINSCQNNDLSELQDPISHTRTVISQTSWRYKSITAIVWDPACGQRWRLPIESFAMAQILSNISASKLVEKIESNSSNADIGNYLDSDISYSRAAVAKLLESLVAEKYQSFQAKIRITSTCESEYDTHSDYDSSLASFGSINSSIIDNLMQRSDVELSIALLEPNAHISKWSHWLPRFV